MFRYLLMIWLMAGLLSLSVQAQEHSEAYTNRLINSQDPYLLLHAHNPVDWYPWGPEALDRARRENKPIFISVGYSTCYWCHVAEREIYSNPEIAKLMNQWFVNIKIDREERPDLDRIYMRATQILTGRGGWPNNVFLTPELKPFYAGSYFPPADQDGRSGFPRILNRLHEAWVQDNERLLKTAESVFQKLQPASRNVAMQNIDFTSMENWMERAVRQSVSSFDSLQGGFGQGPTKFPKSPRLSMLLVTNNEQQSSNASEIVRITLEAMAAGGIMDQLAGGFHRYSTEPGWSIPHFEKMLYDNAQLLGIYARAYEVNQSPVLRLAALRTAHYLSTEMRAPKGGFYSAQDAEVNGVEGESYAWTKDEIKSVLGEDDGGAFFELYSLVPMPKAHFGHQQPEGGVLRLKSDTELSNDEQIAAAIRMQKSSRNKLLAVRQQRAQPARDEKIVIADNALAIMGFSRAGQSLNEPALTKTAVRTANWLWKNAFDQNSGELKHQLFKNQVGGAGFLDDYALLGLAFINLYEDTGKKRWRLRAEKIANEMLSRFARPDGDLAASWDNIDLVVAPPEQGDSIKPSGKSSAIALLMELSVITGEKHYAISAYKALLPLYSRINANPAAWGTLLSHLNDTNLKAIQDIANEPELATTRERPLNSSAYVHARGFWTNSPDAPSLTLTINIDKGYHINANPASDPFLIATELYIEGQADLGVDYPVSQSFRPEFAPQGIEVYQGRIILKARPAKIDTGGYPELSLRVQACNDEVCLSPATILVPASGAASK